MKRDVLAVRRLQGRPTTVAAVVSTLAISSGSWRLGGGLSGVAECIGEAEAAFKKLPN